MSGSQDPTKNILAVQPELESNIFMIQDKGDVWNEAMWLKKSETWLEPSVFFLQNYFFCLLKNMQFLFLQLSDESKSPYIFLDWQFIKGSKISDKILCKYLLLLEIVNRSDSVRRRSSPGLWSMTVEQIRSKLLALSLFLTQHKPRSVDCGILLG